MDEHLKDFYPPGLIKNNDPPRLLIIPSACAFLPPDTVINHIYTPRTFNCPICLSIDTIIIRYTPDTVVKPMYTLYI